MISTSSNKVTASHLQRDAFLYIRQSTLKQVVENTESTDRQYALRQRARALGWSDEQIQVIDVDLGKSGASSADRQGFQNLVAQVSLGKAGIVLGLEVSRLARNNADWHRLLEICAITDTLILDEEGIYHPRDFNDRLLLGLKGAMSEAELHLLRARLRGGILNKARRGELKMSLSIGYVHDPQDRIIKDTNQRVRQTIELFFSVFQRSGSASAVVKHFNENNLLFPRRLRGSINRGDIVWGPLIHTRALQLLHHPIYAGAYSFGRTRRVRNQHGRFHSQKLPRDQWTVLIPDTHEGYITFERFEKNDRQLQDNAQTRGQDRVGRPPGEGPALLQGLIVCANCGRKMTVRYHSRKGQLFPDYVRQHDRIEHGGRVCQTIPGAPLDQAIAKLLLQELVPANLEVSLQVEAELQKRQDQTDHARSQAIEQLRYETQLAQRRYLQVDPDNRLVATELEASWNEKLLSLQQAQEDHQRFQAESHHQLDEQMRQRIHSLTEDFPRLWHDAKAPQKERKQMVRLLIEDVTVHKASEITMQIRFKGGALRTLNVSKAKHAGQLRKTPSEIVQTVDKLLDNFTPEQIALQLNKQKLTSGTNRSFTRRIILRIQRAYGLKPRYDRLRKRGLLTPQEIAERLNICTETRERLDHTRYPQSRPLRRQGQRLIRTPGPKYPQDARTQKSAKNPKKPIQVTKNP